MSRPFLRRLRVLVLLLAFGLGLAGNALANAVVASQMPGPMHGVTSQRSATYPGCGTDDQDGMVAGNCWVASCWTTPALPAHGTAPQPWPKAGFSPSAATILAGIATAPDPYPPRSLLHA